MKYNIILLITLFFGITHTLFAQKHVDFTDSDKGKTVLKGDTILIHVDTAYVLNSDITHSIDQNLNDYKELRKRYQKLLSDNKALIKELKKAQKYVEDLIQNNNTGKVNIADLQLLAQNINTITDDLDKTNLNLETINQNFKSQIDALSDENAKLKKQIRKVWWDVTTDKIVSGIGGFALGVGITLLIAATS